jgi:hypothetical protein
VTIARKEESLHDATAAEDLVLIDDFDLINA